MCDSGGRIDNYWRVIHSDGSVPQNFTAPADAGPKDEYSAKQRLLKEGSGSTQEGLPIPASISPTRNGCGPADDRRRMRLPWSPSATSASLRTSTSAASPRAKLRSLRFRRRRCCSGSLRKEQGAADSRRTSDGYDKRFRHPTLGTRATVMATFRLCRCASVGAVERGRWPRVKLTARQAWPKDIARPVALTNRSLFADHFPSPDWASMGCSRRQSVRGNSSVTLASPLFTARLINSEALAPLVPPSTLGPGRIRSCAPRRPSRSPSRLKHRAVAANKTTKAIIASKFGKRHDCCEVRRKGLGRCDLRR
jgi:hypothetical protein